MIKKFSSFCSKIKSISKKSTQVVIKVQGDHFFLQLNALLDWKELIKIAVARRAQVLKKPQIGRRPHLRQMLGIIILRSLKNITLQEAMDLGRHYAPARIFCGFIDENGIDSGLTLGLDFRTISDFEIMMGKEGLRQINASVLRKTAALGFADIDGLCADTTAQEAAIPYPTEVGLMRSFTRSVTNGVSEIKMIPGKLKIKVQEIAEKFNKEVRKYRLFAKTLEQKKEIGANILKLVSKLEIFATEVLTLVESGKIKINSKSRRFFNRLPDLLKTFSKLKPQRKYFLKNGKPTKTKIISLEQPEARALPRGKDGKDVEFGYKWIINRVRNGYIWLTVKPELGNISDYDCAKIAVKEHIVLFGKAPKEFCYDRAASGEDCIEAIKLLGVKRVAIAPKGKAKWAVSNRCRKKMVRERAQVEGNIGCLKRVGFNRPYSKNTQSTLRAGHRAALRLNLTKFVRDIRTAVEAA